MAIRDLLWGCPLCRAPGAIRRTGARERCRECGATFRRSRGARIVVERDGVRNDRSAQEWLARLGPAQTPEADPQGLILGPERVRVKFTRQQRPLRWRSELLGWVEVYSRPLEGDLSLRLDGLHFRPARGRIAHWRPEDLTGLQPASSAIQIGLRDSMVSAKFIDGSVRLWTRALTDLLRNHYRLAGREVVELQPFLRTGAMAKSLS